MEALSHLTNKRVRGPVFSFEKLDSWALSPICLELILGVELQSSWIIILLRFATISLWNSKFKKDPVLNGCRYIEELEQNHTKNLGELKDETEVYVGQMPRRWLLLPSRAQR